MEFINDKIIVEDYSSSFQFLDSYSLEPELPQWGGFFAGEDYNFFVFGQFNSNESDNTEVIRVVKYSKDWQRLGSASLYGGNTETPFRSGTVAFAELNGSLYIRTSHRIYKKGSDGLNHQANMTLVVQESDTIMKESYYAVSHNPYGYVSHSFNQFILTDQSGNIVCLDHGDAYPRAIVLHRGGKESMVQTFLGAIGENTTGAFVGGFAETSSGYVTAYNYAGSNNGLIDRSVYLGYTSKDGLQSKTVKISQPGANTPMLVSTGLNGGYLVLTDCSDDEYGSPYEKDFFYTNYIADGSTGAVQRISGPVPLSDCQPIYWNGKVVWYVTDDSAPVFYTLDSAGVKKILANGAVSGSTTAGETSTAFSDVPASYWGYGGIQNMVNNGIVSGYPDGTFKPNSTISYIEFVAMVTRSMRSEFLAENTVELSGSPWYIPILKTAKLSAMLEGTAIQDESRWTQIMNQPITRAEIAKILDQTIFVGDGGLAFDEDLLISQISDWASVDESHRFAVIQMYAGGVLTGYSDGTIRPNATATRAEACVIVDRAIRLNNSERLPDAKDL